MTRDSNILLTFAVLVDGNREKGFLSHEAPPKQAKGGASAKAAPPVESCIGFFTCGIVTACRPHGDVEESAQGGNPVTAYVPTIVDRCAGLLVSQCQSEIPAKLFGIVQVGKPCSGGNQSCGQCDSYALNGCEQPELTIELLFRNICPFLFKARDLHLQRDDDRRHGYLGRLVDNRQNVKRVHEILCGGELLPELPQYGALLFEQHKSSDGILYGSGCIRSP